MSTGLQSTYSGTLAVTMVDRAIVAKMLLPGLSLAATNVPAGGAPAEQHPVVHLIGDQRAPKWLVGGYEPHEALGPGYQEMILLVPFVVIGAGTQWHNYAFRMYLDSLIPVVGGNEGWGYAKELARLVATESPGVRHYEITTRDGATTWFKDDLDRPVHWTPEAGAAATLPRWNDLRTILQMPILGVRPPGPVLPQELLCSWWEMDFSHAELAPTVSRHQVVTPFRSGMQDWVALGPLASAPDGAVAMRKVRWRLAALPEPC